MNGNNFFKNLSIKNKYWLAGYLEGEGSFIPGPPSSPGQPIISLCTTDEDVIQKISSLFKVKYHRTRKDYYLKMGWKATYQIRLTGGRAYHLMLILKPLMGIRRKQQIEKAVNSYRLEKPRIEKEDLLKIRKMLNNKKLSKAEIGRRIGLSRETISKISLNKTHKEIRE